MVKQKVVMKLLSMEDAKKRSKALKTAVGLPGVISAALEGDRIVVVGDGVDSIEMTIALRKKMGHVELISVGSAEEKKAVAVAAAAAEPKCWQPVVWPYQACLAQPYTYVTRETNQDSCSIM